MCGRYRLTAKERYIRDHFGLEVDVEWSPRWNIAPTQQIPVVLQDAKTPQRKWTTMRWGLIPSWAKDSGIAVKTINAMSETAADKPAFREAIRRRRCLVPTNGFYEWLRLGKKEKQPYHFGMADEGIFAFAGLWERWRDPADKLLETCTILTTSPNALVANVHNRMPAILGAADYDLWLDPGITNPDRVVDLLKPLEARLMRCYPVSTRVNRVDNDDPECANEVPPQTPVTLSLF